jgi:hypothetical protein
LEKEKKDMDEEEHARVRTNEENEKERGADREERSVKFVADPDRSRVESDDMQH